MNRIIWILPLFLLLMNSCLVSKKKFDEQKALADQCLKGKTDCEDQLTRSQADVADLNTRLGNLQSVLDKTQSEKSDVEQLLGKCNASLADQQKEVQKLMNDLKSLSLSSSSEKDKLSRLLNEKQQELTEKEARLNEQQKTADMLAQSLKEREQRVRELEQLIARKDSAVNALKKKITDALTGFQSSELQVSQRDGKVYVSMSDKLLFKSGSFMVDAKGKGAILKIAEVLNKQTDIGIVVEGHTDNKPYISPDGNIKNNWDLSVMRASSVAFLMAQEGKVDPKRIDASGKGEHVPVVSNDTPEGRARNRRIEVVLSPDLRSIFDMLNTGN